MTRLVLASLVVLLALAAGAATLFLAPGQTIAVFGAVVAVLGLAVNLYRDFIDRGDLRFEVQLGGPTNKDIVVGASNAGRRPVRVEGLGFWHEKSDEAVSYPYWFRSKTEPLLAATLGESDARASMAHASSVASFYVRYKPAEWLFARPLNGRLRWLRLPEDVRDELARVWPEAQESQRREEEAEAAKPGELDAYGHPVRPPRRRA